MKRGTPSSSSRDPIKKRLSGLFRKSRDSLASTTRTGSVSRLSSSVRRIPDQGPQKDPRNLSNRAKQREMQDDILNFLQINGYPHQINQKTLQAPTSKDFYKIFEFLYGFIDKAEKIDKKFEEEVPRLLKQVFYPFPIPKSTMFTIGSLHTWPTLLGALHWLVQLIESCQSVDPDEILFCQNKDDPLYGCDKIVNCYYNKTYKDFLNGKSETEDDDLQLTDAILLQTGAINENDEILQQEIAELEKELAALQAEPDRLKELQDSINFMNSDCEKMQQTEQDQTNEKKILDMKQKQYVEELNKYDFERIRQISTAGSIEHEKERLSNCLATAKDENEKLQSRCWEKEINFSKMYNKVDKILSEYNDHVRNLTFDTRAMDYLQGHDISMKFDHQERNILDPAKFKNTIKDVLIQAKTKVSSHIHQLESERITEEDRLDKLNEECIEKQHEITVGQTRLDDLTAEVESLQEKTTQEQKAAEDVLNSLREENKILETTNSNTYLEKKQRELVELKERLKEEGEDMELKSQKAAEFLNNVVQKCLEHKSLIESGVEKIRIDKAKDVSELENKTYAWQCLKDPEDKENKTP